MGLCRSRTYVFVTFIDTIFMSVCLQTYAYFTAQCILYQFMCTLGTYKWALSVSWRLIKHKLHIKVAKGCVRQDRSEQRVFTVIKVNSGQPLGIALLLRHVAAALSSQLYGLSVSNLQIPLFFKRKKRKHVKANLPTRSLLPPSHTESSLPSAGVPPLTSE